MTGNEGPGPGTRILLHLYSTQNIVGCVLGLVGLALYFAGVIDKGWWAIVGGLYLAGMLGVPRSEAAERVRQAQLTEENLRDALEDLIRNAGRRLPARARDLLHSIRDTVEGLLPALRDLEGEGALDLRSRHTLMATVTNYIPETVGAYLRLPPAFAKLHHGAGGKTPEALLVDQLSLLDGQLKQLARDAYARDVEKISVNGRFLEERFATAPRLE